MLIRIAWRNLWRNRVRSAIVLTSIVVGVTALVFTDALTWGMVRQMLDNRVAMHVGHLQVHAVGFRDDPSLDRVIGDPMLVDLAAARDTTIVASSFRVTTFGLAGSAYNTAGAAIIGVDPAREQHVTSIARSVVEGDYLSGDRREILVSRRIAGRLRVTVGDKVVLTASRTDGSVGTDVFRICGLYTTFDSQFDATHMFITLGAAQGMLGMGKAVTGLVALVRSPERADVAAAELQTRLPGGLEAVSYRTLLPLIVMQIEMYSQMSWIIYLIVGIAMMFGIINVMLMSVYERIREFGVMMSIGMANASVFRMVMFEAFLIGAFGSVVGLVLSWGITYPFAINGIDLGSFASGFSQYGVSRIIYPHFAPIMVINVLAVVPAVVMVGAVYPAFRAVRLKPVEAVRHV